MTLSSTDLDFIEANPSAAMSTLAADGYRPAGPIEFFGTGYHEPALRSVLTDDGRIKYEFEVHRCLGVDRRLTQTPALASRGGHEPVASA